MGHSPVWYKQAVIAALIINPLVYLTLGPFAAGWLILAEFIATLTLAIKCFPLLPGGIIAFQAIVLLQMATPEAVTKEIEHNMPIILLVLFLVTAVTLMKELLIFSFTKLILGIRNKTTVALLFSVAGALMSAMLDALTVISVVVVVLTGLHTTYQNTISVLGQQLEKLTPEQKQIFEYHRDDGAQFDAFLRSIAMHAAVGTMLGGILTLVGEPQNLLIGELMGWSFVEFFLIMAPVTLPVTFSGFVVCILLEKSKWLDYGTEMPYRVRTVLEIEAAKLAKKRTKNDTSVLLVQALGAILLVAGLVAHTYPPFLVGLGVLIFVTISNGVTEEHHIGEAIKESAAFSMVLAVFFAVVAMIHQQHLFDPVTQWIMSFEGKQRLLAYYASTGGLSSISDNVFVASLYITDAKTLYDSGQITRAEFDQIAIAINTGTNIPSISTPNGQAAFLFLLMSVLATKHIQLSYLRMLVLALPYAVVTTIVGFAGIWFFL